MAEAFNFAEEYEPRREVPEGEIDVPCMPHRLFDQAALDDRYPALKVDAGVPEESDIEFHDRLLKEGMRVAAEVVLQAGAYGRRRHQKDLEKDDDEFQDQRVDHRKFLRTAR